MSNKCRKVHIFLSQNHVMDYLVEEMFPNHHSKYPLIRPIYHWCIVFRITSKKRSILIINILNPWHVREILYHKHYSKENLKPSSRFYSPPFSLIIYFTCPTASLLLLLLLPIYINYYYWLTLLLLYSMLLT